MITFPLCFAWGSMQPWVENRLLEWQKSWILKPLQPQKIDFSKDSLV